MKRKHHLPKQAVLVFISIFVTIITVKSQPVFQDGGKAIRGYDPVAYFTENKAVAGEASVTLSWAGATWFFASEENRDLFQADSTRYSPQYGGYCAYGASRGYLATTDPEAFTLLDGKLYLNYDIKIRSIWLTDAPERIRKADTFWLTQTKPIKK